MDRVKSGTHKSRAVMRARILLLSAEGRTNADITQILGCATGTVNAVRKRYRTRGLDAINDAARSGQPKKITAKHEAFVSATACTDAPPGHAHWTLGALKEKLLETHTDLKSVSHEWIRQMLIRAKLKPWREKNVVRSETYA
jgi:transposase